MLQKLNAHLSFFSAKNLSKRNIIHVLGCAIVITGFIFLTYQMTTAYLEDNVRYITEHSKKGPYRFPNLITCPNILYNPERLIELGLDINVSTRNQFESNVLSLKGLDMNTTIRDLKNAHWRLGEMISSLRFDNLVYNYSTDVSSAKYWETYFVLNKPCLRLTLPETLNSRASLTLTLRTKHELEICSWCDSNGIMKHYKNSRDCKAVEKFCNNSSCGYESWKLEYSSSPNQNLFFLQGITSSYTLQNYIPKFRFAHHIVPVEYFVKESRHAHGLDSEECVENCVRKNFEKNYNCTLPTASTMNSSVFSLCKFYTVHLIKESYVADQCVGHCKGSMKTEYLWRLSHYMDLISPFIDAITIKLINNGFNRIYEVQIYPLVKLLSDFGGCAGIFLGVSLFSIMTFCSDSLIKVLQGRKWWIKMRFIVVIIKYFLMVWMVINCLVYVKVYIEDDSTLQVVNFEGRRRCSDVECPLRSTTPNAWAASIFARVALGCQPLANTRKDLCNYQCAFKAISESLDYTYRWHLVDLPSCFDEDYFRVTKLKLVLESYAIKYLTGDTLYESCTNKCSISDTSISENSYDYFPVIQTVAIKSFTNIICFIAGLIGLYFGYSMHEIMIMIQYSKFIFCFKSSKAIEDLSKYMSVLLFLFIAIVVSLIQMHAYVFSNPLYQSSEMLTHHNHLQSVSVCPNFFSSFEMDPLGKYPENITLEDVFTDVSCKMSRTNKFMANLTESFVNSKRCITCTPIVKDITTTRNAIITLKVKINPQVDGITGIFGLLHDDKQNFTWYPDLPTYVAKENYDSVSISHLKYVYPPDHEVRELNGCFGKCVQEEFIFKNCTVQDKCLRKCSQSPFSFYVLKKSDGIIESSWRFHKNFVPIFFNSKKNVSFRLNNEFKTVEVIKFEFQYSQTQILNDVCSIFGFIVGFSLLSIWNDIFHLI